MSASVHTLVPLTEQERWALAVLAFAWIESVTGPEEGQGERIAALPARQQLELRNYASAFGKLVAPDGGAEAWMARLRDMRSGAVGEGADP